MVVGKIRRELPDLQATKWVSILTVGYWRHRLVGHRSPAVLTPSLYYRESRNQDISDTNLSH